MENYPIRQLIFEFRKDSETFETFIEDPSNRLVFQGCRRFIQSRGTGMNPIVLTGDPGTGKTHLLHAMGNLFLESDGTHSVRFLDTGKLVSGIRVAGDYENVLKEVDRFKRADLLLVDDLHLASEEEGVQDQLFHILNDIIGRAGLAAFASRVPAFRLEGFHDHLGSRIRAGVEFPLKPASLDLQKKLVRHFALEENLILPETVVEFILSQFDRNPGALKEIVRRVGRYSLTSKKKVSIPVVKSALEGYRHEGTV